MRDFWNRLRSFRKPLLWAAAGFCFGVACTTAGNTLGISLTSNSGTLAGVSILRAQQADANSAYRFIDPLLAVRGLDASSSAPYLPLQQSISSLIAQEQQGALLDASVYFRDLNTTGGFTLGPRESYAPASLLKVALMMALYKLAETHPDLLSTELSYTGATNANTSESIVSPVQLSPGTYTIEDLIEHMIKYSDNNALAVLVNYLNSTNQYGVLSDLFTELGLANVDFTAGDTMTIGQYSLFFRVLYNATYLSRSDSEHALELLTQTDFTKGISQGVASNVDVAQKFGEYSLVQNGIVTERELNTCGIIYYPDHPYLLCVMTKGPQFAGLESAIGAASQQVFDFTEKLYAHK